MHMIKKLIKTLQDQLIAQMKLITNIDQLNCRPKNCTCVTNIYFVLHMVLGFHCRGQGWILTVDGCPANSHQ